MQRADRAPLPRRDRVRRPRDTGSVAGPLPALEPIFSRDATVHRVGGAVVIPGQGADGARFFEPDELGLDYVDRAIPATGTLTLTHYYATVSGADGEVEDGADRLRAWIGQPPAQVVAPAPATGPATIAQTPAPPTLSRRGRVRVRRSGRTFVVTTRDRVGCPAGCALQVSGRWVATSRARLGAGRSANVKVRLTRAGARALSRRGRLRLSVTISARADGGPAVTKRRILTIRLP